MSLSRSILTLSFFLALAGGCGDKEDTTDSGGAADGTDAADGADASDRDDGASTATMAPRRHRGQQR